MLIEGYTENVKRFLSMDANLLYVFPHQYDAMDYFDLAAHYFRNCASRKSKHELIFSNGSYMRGIIIKDRRDPVDNLIRGFRGPVLLLPKPYAFYLETRKKMLPVIRGQNQRWASLVKAADVQPLNEKEQEQWEL